MNFIDGERRTPSKGEYSPIIDPRTEKELAKVARSDSEDVEAAFAAAKAAFPRWSGHTAAQRQHAVLSIADKIEENAELISSVESENTGKPQGFVHEEEVDVAVDVLRFFSGTIRTALAPAAGEYMTKYTSYVRREPLGVCVQMVPFNYPLLMAVWKLAPALAAGNTIVLKPSHNTPMSVLLLAELVSDVLPRGTINVLCGDREATADITRHTAAQHVSATASTASGLAIANSALTSVKRLHLGLGGKSPAIVFPDADLPHAARRIAQAAYFNGGQDCTAASRVLVASDVHDEFVAELSRQVACMVNAGPEDENTASYGPLNSKGQLGRIIRTLEELPEHAEVAVGGQRIDRPGLFFPPTLVTGVTSSDSVVHTELFGPVATVERFTSEQDVVSLVNSADYGLAASVHTHDHSTAMRVSSNLDYGCVWINTHLPLPSEMPHGGFKQSGFGKDLSLYGIDEFTRVKHVMHMIEDDSSPETG
ncbi:aldehyde dehydrogenase family protein [Actinopolyspora mortivallis]|nr:aldehyde dehydrogenase family protein [Actinopolyspora mortivallis]